MGAIETALVSVADKSGLSEFVGRLLRMGVRILTTGGTGRYLGGEGIETTDVSTVTGQVELVGGLVKTLHPAIHAGILADRRDPSHMDELSSLSWEKIDMVIVNFYPLKGDGTERDLSFIDIGGPAMARAAAKNFASCVPIPHPSWYEPVIDELESKGVIGEDLRWSLATDTLMRTAIYDARTLSMFSSRSDPWIGADSIMLVLDKAADLRYGENPHQRAALYSSGRHIGLDIIKGTLSYNNMLDIDCCLSQLAEFSGNAAAVVKHVSPCGVAEAETGMAALEGAYACDPMSAFGGVIGVNFRFTEECGRFLAKRFVECIIAPEFDEAALKLLRKKKARLVIAQGAGQQPMLLRSALGGVLIQSHDDILFKEDLRFVSGGRPAEPALEDLLFAWKAAKHVKSNAIVFAKSKRTIGIGAGQPSRIDATKIAIRKASEAGHDLDGSVMASDGFFPFADCIELASDAGACAVIQPGGSIRDEEVIQRARALGISMALTSTRHFRH